MRLGRKDVLEESALYERGKQLNATGQALETGPLKLQLQKLLCSERGASTVPKGTKERRHKKK